MKNRIYWCCCAFFSLVIIFSVAYYISFQSSLARNEQEQVKNQSVASSGNGSDNAVSVDGHSKERIGEQTKYVVERYDVADAVYSDKTEPLPQEYIGLNREELEAKLKEYTKTVTAEEEKEGLLYVTLVSFSSDSITVRKVYDNKSNYKFYITVKNGYLIVYKNDKETVQEETDIAYEDLEECEKKEVEQGVYVDSLEQLYSTLESYSS